MTRRRIVYTDPSTGRRYVTPEFNGDKTEFDQFNMGDKCTATWDEIMEVFNAASTPDEFKAASDQMQGYYSSSIAPAEPPEPVLEINTEALLPDELKNCDLIFLAESHAD